MVAQLSTNMVTPSEACHPLVIFSQGPLSHTSLHATPVRSTKCVAPNQVAPAPLGSEDYFKCTASLKEVLVELARRSAGHVPKINPRLSFADFQRALPHLDDSDLRADSAHGHADEQLAMVSSAHLVLCCVGLCWVGLGPQGCFTRSGSTGPDM